MLSTHSQKKNAEAPATPTMLSVLRARPHYRRMLIGNTISQLGDWLSYVAVSLLVTRSGEGGVALALVYVAHTLPNALAAPLAGVLADRHDRRRLMIGSYLACALLTGAMCLAADAGAIWALQALLFARAGVSAVGFTARQAATPSVVERRELYAANALNSLIWSVLFTSGVALGGLLSAAASPTAVIALDALTFLLSALAVWRLPPLPPAAPPPGRAAADEGARGAAGGGLWAAWGLARRDPRLLAALLAKSPAGAMTGAGWIALNLLAAAHAPTPADAALAVGAAHAARGLGTGVGPLLLRRLWPTSVSGPTLLALAALLCFLWAPSRWSALAALVVWGMGSSHNFVRSSATLQLHAPQEALGRLTALDFLFFTTTQSALALLTGLLLDLGAPLSAGVYASMALALMGVALLRRLEGAPRGRALS